MSSSSLIVVQWMYCNGELRASPELRQPNPGSPITLIILLNYFLGSILLSCTNPFGAVLPLVLL